LIGKNAALDANGTTKIGYGFLGSSNSNNHIEREYTFGINQTIWKDAKYGAINVMGQYEYLTRNPGTSPWARWTTPATAPSTSM